MNIRIKEKSSEEFIPVLYTASVLFILIAFYYVFTSRFLIGIIDGISAASILLMAVLRKKNEVVKLAMLLIIDAILLLKALIGTWLVGINAGYLIIPAILIPVILYYQVGMISKLIKIISFIMVSVDILVATVGWVISLVLATVYQLEYLEYCILRSLHLGLLIFAVIYFFMTYSITSEKVVDTLTETNEQMTYESEHDPLTGLLNRRGYLGKAENEFRVNKDFCIALCDIDFFKKVNDTYGHDAGDEVLRQLTALMQNSIHDGYVCRWGGEELLVHINGDLQHAQSIMNDIRIAIQNLTIQFENQEINCTISIGIASCKNTYKMLSTVITRADGRLYVAKATGRNRVIVEGDNYDTSIGG